MTNFKVGDKVVITNVEGIMFGNDYFKNGDVTEVLKTQTEFDGRPTIDVLVPLDKVDDATDMIDGKPTLYIVNEEFKHLAKLMPDNAQKGGK